MCVEVLYFKIIPTKKRIGILKIKYHDLVLNCELVYHPTTKKCWVRMPEKWINDKKVCYCFWPTKKLSDEFQNKVLNILYKKEGFTLKQAVEIHEKHKKTPKKQNYVDLFENRQ